MCKQKERLIGSCLEDSVIYVEQISYQIVSCLMVVELGWFFCVFILNLVLWCKNLITEI